MTNILYNYFRSSAAYRVRIALNFKGITAEYIAINLKPGVDEQQSDNFKTLNPQGRIPYYCEDDFHLGQSPAILEYLEDSYPQTPLFPDNHRDKAMVRQLCFLIACDVHPLNNLSVLKYLKSEFSANEQTVTQWYSHWIDEGLSAFEALLQVNAKGGRYCFGDKVTMADIYLIPQVYNAHRFSVSLDAFPTILKIEAECQKLPDFIQAAP